MKMSERFALPVHAPIGVELQIEDNFCDSLVIAVDDTVDIEAIAHAINSHDALVEALEMVIDGQAAHDLVGITGFTEEECHKKIIDVLARAKGEL